MTVGELKNLLAQFNDDAPVILSIDGEGNGYSFLSDGAEYLYDPSDRRYIEQVWMTHEELDVEITKENGYTEEDRALEGAVSAVVLWPL